MTDNPVSEHGSEVVTASYEVYMVRKKLCISVEPERTRKARARVLRVSEAELVRWLLDG